MADKNEDNEFRSEDLISAESLDPLGELQSEKNCTQTTGLKREQFQTKGHVAERSCVLIYAISKPRAQ